MELDRAKELFFVYLEKEKKYSGHTLISYRNDLEQCFEYLKKQYETQDVEDISTTYIRSFLAQLKQEDYTATSINRKLSSLKTFFRYLNRKLELTHNPTSILKALKKPGRLPIVVEKDKLNHLLNEYLDENKGITNYENVLENTLIHLLYHTGIRSSELLNIKESDLDFSRKTIKVLGKGNKERMIPLSNEIIEIIKFHFLPIKNKTIQSATEFLFTKRNGKKQTHKWLYNLTNRELAKVTTQKKKSPHVLRHSFATHLLDGGADINAIKELLGHSNLAATQIYTHNSMEKLRQIHKMAHPMNKKKA